MTATPPLTLGEILDRTIQLYRRNFLHLAGIATPAAAIVALISGGLVLFFSSQLFTLGQLGQTGQDTTTAATQSVAMMGVAFLTYVVIGVPVFLVTFAMALSALSYAGIQMNQGVRVTIRGAYQYSFSHFWRHVGILFFQSLLAAVVPYFVYGAIVFVGIILAALVAKSGAGNTLAPLFIILLIIFTIALIVACILIWLRLSLAYPSSVGEEKKAWDSIKRSNQLSNGTRGRIFIMFLLVALVSMVATFALALPMDIVVALVMHKSLSGGHPPAMFMTLLQSANLVAGFLVRIFIMPIYAVALVLFYNDQRTRQEGYDIEQLMARAGWAEFEPSPSTNIAAQLAPVFAPPASAQAEPIVETPFPHEPATSAAEPRVAEFPAPTERLAASEPAETETSHDSPRPEDSGS